MLKKYKSKSVKNTFSLIQIKKLIGKNIKYKKVIMVNN